MRAAGYRGPDLFAPKLVRYIADATGGLSRRVNLVADKALLAAFADNTHTVRLAHVQAAVRDCEFNAGKVSPVPRWMASAALLLAGAALGAGALWWFGGSPAPTTVRPTDTASAATPDRSPASQAVPSNPAPPTAEDPRASASLVGSDDPAAARLAATTRWLEDSDKQGFTIQLAVAADDPGELARYLGHLGKFVETDKLFVYRTRVKDTPYLGVSYGNFLTRQAARAALTRLPEAVRSDRPYIRSAAGIRREAQRSQ